jgi:hypothetical protein
MLLVACHTWDTLGAVAAGWQAALIRGPENEMLGAGPQPRFVVTVRSKVELRRITAPSQARRSSSPEVSRKEKTDHRRRNSKVRPGQIVAASPE